MQQLFTDLSSALSHLSEPKTFNIRFQPMVDIAWAKLILDQVKHS